MNKFSYQKKILLVPLIFCIIMNGAYGQTHTPVSNTDTLVGKIRTLRPWTAAPFSVRLGAFGAVNQTDIGAGTDNNPYSIINWENELGMNRNTYSGLLNINARIGKHNRIDFSYYNIYRSKTIELEKEIHFGEHDYPLDSEVKMHWNTNIFRLSYGYSLISNEHVELGVLAGFHVMRFGFGLELIGNTLQLSFKDDLKFTAPLPDFGLWGTYALAKRWAISVEASYFSVKIKNIKGRVLNGGLSVQYKLSKHWGFDIGYTGFGVKINLDRKFLKSDFDWYYSGIFANVTYRFGHPHF